MAFYSIKEQGVKQGNVIFNNLCASDHSVFVLKTHTCSTFGNTTESGTSLELPLSSYSDGDSDDNWNFPKVMKSKGKDIQKVFKNIIQDSSSDCSNITCTVMQSAVGWKRHLVNHIYQVGDGMRLTCSLRLEYG